MDAVAERAKAEMEAKRWTQQDELLAMNAELVHAVYRAVIGTSGSKPPKPLRIKRPSASEPDATVMSHHELLTHVKEE